MGSQSCTRMLMTLIENEKMQNYHSRQKNITLQKPCLNEIPPHLMHEIKTKVVTSLASMYSTQKNY